MNQETKESAEFYDQIRTDVKKQESEKRRDIEAAFREEKSGFDRLKEEKQWNEHQ